MNSNPEMNTEDCVERPPLHSMSLSPAQYDQIVESLTSGLIVVNRDGVILAVNSAAKSFLSTAGAELVAGLRLDAVPAAAPFARIVEEVAFSRTDLFRREFTLMDKDGAKRIIGLNASIMRGASGYEGAIILFTDLTRLRELEVSAEVNRQLATVGELTAKVVHELRNPVTVIRGMSELLERHLESDSASKNRASKIIQETQVLERLIQQFLGFSKPFVLEPVRIPVREVVERAQTLCLSHAKEKEVELAVQYSEPIQDVMADPDKLSRALANIVNNGIDASPAGGRVELYVRQDQEQAVFEILDTGPGVQVAHGDDIFKPFFSTKEDGTGLGLSIVHRTITSHGGTIAFHNRPEGGACFVVRVPVKRDD